MRGDQGKKNDYYSLTFAERLDIDFKIMMYFLIVYCLMAIGSILLIIIYHRKFPKLMSWPES